MKIEDNVKKVIAQIRDAEDPGSVTNGMVAYALESVCRNIEDLIEVAENSSGGAGDSTGNFTVLTSNEAKEIVINAFNKNS
ncbi:MAG: hypothetical protein K2L89_06015 [Muribaculaceae bacterium]|nr:hypothetical protein [Muribaculaceae bacterium]